MPHYDHNLELLPCETKSTLWCRWLKSAIFLYQFIQQRSELTHLVRVLGPEQF
jgi:hypothetical protein